MGRVGHEAESFEGLHGPTGLMDSLQPEVDEASRETIVRSLRRLVYTDRILPVNDALKLLHLFGIPKNALEGAAAHERET